MARAPDLAPQRERPPELDADDEPSLSTPSRLQHDTQDAGATMIAVPHDQPIRFSFEMLRRFSMKSTAEPTSLTASAVVAKGGFSVAGASIAAGRVERP